MTGFGLQIYREKNSTQAGSRDRLKRRVLTPSYISRRRKRSSFSRHEQFEHSMQQTTSTATPTVTRTASTLALIPNQCTRLFIADASNESMPEKGHCPIGTESMPV